MPPHPPQWRRMQFKKNKVWAETDDSGELLVTQGRVRVKYQLDQPHEYRVYPQALSALPPDQEQRLCREVPSDSPSGGDAPAPPGPEAGDQDSEPALPPSAVAIYTDGASSGNPGPSGIGVVLRWGDHEKEVSRFIGEGTNNIAELEAIRVGLELLKRTDLPVRVFTDSSYALGVLTLGWKAKANRELVARTRKEMKRFNDLRLIKVKGHSGVAPNERADRLAVSAIENA